MADDFQGEISNLLHRHSIFTRHEKPIPKTIKHMVNGRWMNVVTGWESPNRATPDLTGGNGHQIHVEVKTGKDGRFEFDAWTPEQQAWAAEWREKYGCEYWIALVIETKDARFAKGLRNKRGAFIVPYPAMIKAMRDIQPHQASINYAAPHKLILRNNGLFAINLWDKFELYWEKGGWHFPEHHPFAAAYLTKKYSYLYPDFGGEEKRL